MKQYLIALLATLTMVSGSLVAQVGGPPRKPVPPPSPPGGVPLRIPTSGGVVIKPSVLVTPAPKPTTLIPRPQARTLPRTATPSPKVLNVLPGTPALRVAPSGGVVSPTLGTHVITGPKRNEVIRPAIVNPPGPVGGPGAGIRLDLRALRGPLSIPPRRVSSPVVVLVNPVVPLTLFRVYDSTRSVVVVAAEDGQRTELPYLPMPILFARGTADLLDQTAADVLQSLGSTLLDLHRQDQSVRFEIEGHSSPDGEAADGLNLSTRRASRIQTELVSRYGVPAAILSFKGFGDSYADYRDGTEEQMQLDRRVLVVRTQ